VAGSRVPSSTVGKEDSGPPPNSPLASAASTWSPQEVVGSSRSVSTDMGVTTTSGEEGGAAPVVGATTCVGSSISGNHGHGTQEVDGDGRDGVGSRIAGVWAPDWLPPNGVGPRRPGRREPWHSLAPTSPLTRHRIEREWIYVHNMSDVDQLWLSERWQIQAAR